MSEQYEAGERPSSDQGAAAALAMESLDRDAPIGDDARQYLHRQVQLTQLQIHELKREFALRHWSLRIHHISDVMKLAFECAAAFILLAAAVFLAGAIWIASHDKSLVIEAFDVPPDLVERGLSGQVISARIEDRLSWMQAHTITSRPAGTYRHDWGDDIKVQIPETGISIGEMYRYLAGWLGNQTHISGAIWRTPKGLAVATRAGTNAAPVLFGSETDLDALLVKAAEQTYRQTQPYRYIAYLDRQGRIAEELVAARALALGGPTEERPWAYTRWGVTLESLGDLRGALEKQRMATLLGPTLPHTWYNLASVESAVGHDEGALRDNLRALDLLQSPAADQLAPFAVAVDIPIITMVSAEATGDYRKAIAQVPYIETIANYGASHQSAPIMGAADLASDHDLRGSLKVDHGPISAEETGLQLGAGGSFELQPLPTFQRALALGNWSAARDDLLKQDASPAVREPAVRILLPVLTWPWLAYAEARSGDFKSAHTLIDRTPLDCYLCLRMRADIDAAQGSRRGASYWFGRAIAAAPSIPFAYADWGAMLMAKGDNDGAIAKFTLAHAKGPHFADPLEMWGEALMQKNRSDLALAKFAEANKYAPNWGRLHLEWGKALMWSGDKAGARRQFATAAALELSPSDRSELSRMNRP
jgi:tetratricopeptide (TPR) repeat protein